ncbi:MAG: bifunctional oligoribonuclease/PAP phosphatase NrnA [Bacteroidaceae bacterium]
MIMNDLLNKKELSQWNEIMRHIKNVVICGHKRPDGDAIGSSLGFADYLRSQGKNVTVIMPNSCPDFFMWLPGATDVICYDRNTANALDFLKKADLICCLDFNNLKRIDAFGDAIEKTSAFKIMIDHHPYPEIKADIALSHPEMSSTSEMIFRLIWQLGGFDSLSQNGAIAIYCGMMTDTGAFTYNSNDPVIYLIISHLLTKGINKDKIYRNVYNNYSEGRIRMMGYILYEKLQFYPECSAAFFTLTSEELTRFNYKRGDSEGFVNLPLSVKGIKLSISLREDTEKHTISVSLRSVDNFPCNKMATEFFNGGGHLNAAGGELICSMEEAVEQTLIALKKYKTFLNSGQEIQETSPFLAKS